MGRTVLPVFLPSVMEYSRDVPDADLMLLMMPIEKELGRTGSVHWGARTLELDLLFTWYLATVKVICLRFDKPPYDMFCRLKEDILANMPGCVNNKYIKTSMRELYQPLLKLFACYVTTCVLCRCV